MTDLEITRVAFLVGAGVIGLVLYFLGRWTGWQDGQRSLLEEAERVFRSQFVPVMIVPARPDEGGDTIPSEDLGGK